MFPIFPLAPDFCLFATSAATATGGSLSGSPIAMVAVCAMEIVLGMDNLVFFSVLSSKLPKEQKRSARLFVRSVARLAGLWLVRGKSEEAAD